MSDAAGAAEQAARASYGRLLAYVAARTHDIAEAEDALSDAFLKALSVWPKQGVPANPDAWLLTVARNRLIDRQRHLARFPMTDELADVPDTDADDSPLPERRLVLMMVCAHPAIASDLHAPLMLQTVMGLDARQIARLFRVSPAALAKRLVRAKAKIHDAGIPFVIPEASQLPARGDAILEAIYAVHAHDWLAPSDAQGAEALYLVNLLTQLVPDDAETLGLAALITFSHARASARIVGQTLVPITEQDVTLWDRELIAHGKALLSRAYALGQIGRFQIAAAIEAAHCARLDSGETDWRALNQLYHAYVQFAPSLGARVAQAVVISRLHGTEAGLAALATLDSADCQSFQPFLAARADLLMRTGQVERAAADYERAIALATDEPTIRFLKARLAALR